MEKPVQLQPRSHPQAASPADPPPQSRLSILFAAPHRSMFLAGAVQAPRGGQAGEAAADDSDVFWPGSWHFMLSSE